MSSVVASPNLSPELHSKLTRELGRRLVWGGLSYALFATLFTPQLGSARSAGWAISSALALLGVMRTLCSLAVARATEAEVEREGKRLVTVAMLQSTVFGVFVATAFLSVYGSTVSECLMLVGVAGLSSVSASLFSPIPRLAWMHLGAQLGPSYVWAIFAGPRYGWLLGAFVVIHLISIIQLVRMQGENSRVMFAAQMALEKQSADLRQARDEAEKASSARMRFLAHMSHEIRTPLNGVIGLAQVLGDTPLTDRQRSLLDDLSRSGRHLLAVVNDILDLGKVNSGMLTLERVRFHLPHLIRDVTGPATVLAEAKKLRFDTRSADGTPLEVEGDPVRIRQVISNLLSNAVKFTERGEVTLTVSAPRPGWVRVAVADTGIGLSATQVTGLFQDFHQVDSSTTRRFGGTGLGLAISYRLVELMGGRFEVDSRPGKGSLFSFEIPLPASERASSSLADVGEISTLPEGIRVLIAEDNAINRRVTESMVAKPGIQVDAAENGRIALELHLANPYDIILMDCQMPEMDGFKATELIRALPGRLSLTPILGVTASAFEEDGERCKLAGMDGHVTKPVNRETLIRAMTQALKMRSSEGA